jgi:hypothetical protein
MMKKLLVYLLFTCCTVWTAHAQQMTWGPVLEANKDAIIKTILPFDGGFYIVKTIDTKKQKGIYLEKYNNSDLNREKEVFFPFPSFPTGRTEYEKILLNRGRIFWFVSNFDPATRKHQLFQVEIDGNLEKASEPLLADMYDNGTSRSLAGFTIVQSTNKKYTLYIRKFPFDKYSNEQYYFIMHDSAMHEIWKKEIEVPYTNNLLDISEKLVDNSGNVHLLATLAPEKQKGEVFSRSISANKYLLISYYAAENKMKEFEITLDGKYITSVTAGVSPSGNIAIGGFYSNTNSLSLAGTFYLTISPETKQVITLNQKPFDKDFLREFMSEKSVNKGGELTDFYFDHFVLNEDGSALLVAEEYFKQTYTYFDPYNQLYYDNNTYNFNSIIVIKVDMKGEIEWTRKISKRQVSSTGVNEFYSYSLAKGEKNLYVTYNDNVNNMKDTTVIDEANVYALTQTRYALPVVVVFDEKGNATKHTLYKSADKMLLLPSVSRRINQDNYLICRARRNNIQFGIFKIK